MPFIFAEARDTATFQSKGGKFAKNIASAMTAEV